MDYKVHLTEPWETSYGKKPMSVTGPEEAKIVKVQMKALAQYLCNYIQWIIPGQGMFQNSNRPVDRTLIKLKSTILQMPEKMLNFIVKAWG
jgi:hypothetical protein